MMRFLLQPHSKNEKIKYKVDDNKSDTKFKDLKTLNVKKRPLTIKAIQINEDFIVDTLEGTQHGKAGDYLLEGIKGELYPCDKEIFEETYESI